MNNILKIDTLLQNRYTVTDLLSSHTGFGITYKVKDSNHPNQPIRILKQLKKPTASKLDIEKLPIQKQKEILNNYWQECLRLFRTETEILRNLGKKYKQIPTIHDQFTEGGEEFYVQEYIEGHSLNQEVLQNQQLSEQNTISLLIEILEVFEYIQNNPGYAIIHRDIKPDNIIRRSSDNKLVIIDFGLAKEVTVPGIKVGSILGGTKGYIAPEILLGRVSFASDIYSIGMIGIFAITGEDPSYTHLLAKNWQTKANVSPEFADIDSNGEPVTKVKYQDKIRDLIEWKRRNFVNAGFPPQRRCDEVTPKLQTAYDNETLKDLTWGYSEAENDPHKNFKSLCTTTGKNCHTLILTLLDTDDGDVELKAFTAVLNGDAEGAFRQKSCAVKPRSNLTCTVDIFKVFKDK